MGASFLSLTEHEAKLIAHLRKLEKKSKKRVRVARLQETDAFQLSHKLVGHSQGRRKLALRQTESLALLLDFLRRKQPKLVPHRCFQPLFRGVIENNGAAGGIRALPYFQASNSHAEDFAIVVILAGISWQADANSVRAPAGGTASPNSLVAFVHSVHLS